MINVNKTIKYVTERNEAGLHGITLERIVCYPTTISEMYVYTQLHTRTHMWSLFHLLAETPDILRCHHPSLIENKYYQT